MEVQVSSSSLSPPPLASPELGGRSRGATLRLRPPRWADCSDLLDGVARGHGHPLHGGRRWRRPPRQAASAAAGASPVAASRGPSATPSSTAPPGREPREGLLRCHHDGARLKGPAAAEQGARQAHRPCRGPPECSPYLAELLAERQKLGPFVQVLPFCTRLLNQEILRASTMAPNHNFVDPDRIEHGSPLRLPGHPVNGQPMDLEGWTGMQTEQMGVLQASSMGWNGAPALVGTPVVKKVVRLDVPLDKYPNYNLLVTCWAPKVTP
ncbi:KH domain-containing protein [Panicum miliaceum]|uniref:KH domain-containing protein n=1 Tax=Panicum miliaceum TaxID=4540 RepID=A0A3L6PKZ2_PANMI|nr:KH domain-containing protein [Panicum miliaceum]